MTVENINIQYQSRKTGNIPCYTGLLNIYSIEYESIPEQFSLFWDFFVMFNFSGF